MLGEPSALTPGRITPPPFAIEFLIGLPSSLDMILTGKRVDANKAKKLGFVDEVVEEYELEGTAINIARQLSVGKKFKKRNLTVYDNLEKFGLFRNYIFNEAKKNVDKATGGKMPGPYKIIKTMKENYGKSKIDYLNADIIGFQETKAQDDQVLEALKEVDGYHIYSSSAVKKGYSGTAILSKKKPIEVSYGLGITEHDQEGRIISAEFDQFYFITNHQTSGVQDSSDGFFENFIVLLNASEFSNWSI